MRKSKIIQYTVMAWAVILGLSSCGEESMTSSCPVDAKSTPMNFAISHPGGSRATETDFEVNDKIGLYVAKADAPLEIGGNLVNNEPLTYDGTKWNALLG